MKLRTVAALLGIFLLPNVVTASPEAAQKSGAARKIKVLIVDGQNNHDWAMTTAATKEILLQAGLFTVDVSTTPRGGSAEEWAAWRPDFSGYDVVLSNYNGRMWPEPVRDSFVEFVKKGGGVVIVHAANNAFSGWKEYNEMIGLGWRGNKFGKRVEIEDASGALVYRETGQGPGAGHGRQHDFVVKVRQPSHPIMKGLPSEWMHAKDELYHGQRGPAANMTILSSAFSAKGTGGTGAHEPITWVIPYGKGKVVTTVMGHHSRGQKRFVALHCVGFQTIVARSAEWVTTGKVTLKPPASFPTKDAASVKAPRDVTWKTR